LEHKSLLVRFAIKYPKLIFSLIFILTILTGSFIFNVKVDTDPENMLSAKEAVRVFHSQMKKEFSLHDMIVLGVVNEKHINGVFNKDSLAKVYELTEFAKTLVWDNEGVIEKDIIAPSTVDNIEQGGVGVVNFSWLMQKAPETDKQALEIKEKAQKIPFLNGTLISEDGKAVCIYLPVTSKNLSYKIYSALKNKISEFKGNDQFFITGLPVAEDTFGVEMFKQMAISAPIAMFIIFLLMLYFFRKLILIIAPMIIALISVVITMGLLIGMGHTVHIMTSMIPIFIMPIAVLDSIHILSEFFEKYQKIKSRKQTIIAVMNELFKPMLYTSLTSSAGFASLALTPIPPVQVFGIYVAVGIMVAWLLTIILLPAYIVLIKKEKLDNFGVIEKQEGFKSGFINKILDKAQYITFYKAKFVILGSFIILIIAGIGISLIEINDNPTRWFEKKHPIRVADKVLNEHFGGTYMAYLSFEAQDEILSEQEKLNKFISDFTNKFEIEILDEIKIFLSKNSLDSLEEYVSNKLDSIEDEELYNVWEEVLFFIQDYSFVGQEFKEPVVLEYISKLQESLNTTAIVGKSNSIVDIIKTTHRELLGGNVSEFKVPDTKEAVAQCLITFQNSHRPYDLWHFVTPDFKKTVLWMQLKSGDNRDMKKVIGFVDKYIEEHPMPYKIKHNWFGLTYINVVWQEKIVKGMFQAFIGSFLVVFLLMTYFFRSALWGILSMIPLTITIILIYGAIGFIGKDYDMPIAVLSSLTLGLAVDFAIHFLARVKDIYKKEKSWKNSISFMFAEPARAISRNILVISIGFLPLLAAPLMPYKTVGVFLAVILAVSGAGTLLILPALIKILEKYLFVKNISKFQSSCNCITCFISSLAFVLFIMINIHQFFEISWNVIGKFSFIGVVFIVCICFLMRIRCKREI
jgi:uncharacterized protein